MDKTTLDHIFEPFFTSKPAGEGTGLGLAMVYGIVQQSGGAIRVDSEPGQGTTFKIYFPRLDASVEMAPELASLVGAVGGDETILVVEDNEDVLFLTVCILERLGYHVLCASNGMEAVEKFGNHAGPIHLMVTDVMMPGMTGRDLAQRMARLRPAMKVLFTSGYTANVLAPQGILDPGVAYLPKPFTPNVLAKKVRRILSGEDSA
jgi:CheY-like chemotaxis protein